MREGFVPEVFGKVRVNNCQRGKEVVLKGGGAFSLIALVDIRQHKLVVTYPFLGYYTAVLLYGLVVRYLEVYLVATMLEAEHDALLGSDAVEVLIGLKGIDVLI